MVLLLWLLSGAASGQAIDNTLSFKNINTDQYFRLSYENDYFSATDKYYTQGIALELVNPKLKNFPLHRLLFTPVRGHTRYGIGLEHDVYTPSRINITEVIPGDRPFAACLFIKSFAITIDSIKKRRFAASLSSGVIGPAAYARELQTEVHRVLPKNSLPYGWGNQVRNDLLLNYQLGYEQQLLSYRNIFSLDAGAVARFGTVSNKVSVGSTILIGYFNTPFATRREHLPRSTTKNNFRIYAYERPEVSFVGYDATLQGGLFNRTCPHTISSSDITRITFQNRFGFVVAWRGMYLEYFQSFISSEFRTGDYHVWGGVQIAFRL